MQLLLNHLGYEPKQHKQLVVQSCSPVISGRFSIYDQATHCSILEGKLEPIGPVSGWKNRSYCVADFSGLEQEGRYYAVVNIDDMDTANTINTGVNIDHANTDKATTDKKIWTSECFKVKAGLFDPLLSDLLYFLKTQRCSGLFDKADRTALKLGTTERVDVHGGWYDASGDTSKYLSHLSYANFMNPQQTPLVVWALLAGLQELEALNPKDSHTLRGCEDLAPRVEVRAEPHFKTRLHDEIHYGADFLVRMQDPQGYFYMTVFDRWSKDVKQRDICSYATQQGQKSPDFQSAYRQGAGVAIAALARASRLAPEGEYAPEVYLATAKKGFAHLERHNREYLSDGQENIIDDYCALLAATELFAATAEKVYADAADQRVNSLCARLSSEGWWRADDLGERSFFHAVEEGFPLVALTRFLEVFPRSVLTEQVKQVIHRALEFALKITHEAPNPFGYPRMYVKMPGSEGRSQFFIPHQNETGYWWQGENSRLASLAVGVRMGVRVLGQPPALGHLALMKRLEPLAQAPLHWLLGCNPFDVCMMQGHGRNNPNYEAGYDNAPGGVCNGITSGLEDEADIDFRLSPQVGPEHSWRWGEQWLPHAAWLFLALVTR